MRRLDEEGGSLKVNENLAVVKAPLGPRGSVEREGKVASEVPTRSRGHVGPTFGMGPSRGEGMWSPIWEDRSWLIPETGC